MRRNATTDGGEQYAIITRVDLLLEKVCMLPTNVEMVTVRGKIGIYTSVRFRVCSFCFPHVLCFASPMGEWCNGKKRSGALVSALNLYKLKQWSCESLMVQYLIMASSRGCYYHVRRPFLPVRFRGRHSREKNTGEH